MIYLGANISILVSFHSLVQVLSLEALLPQWVMPNRVLDPASKA